jgi:hypothetical protein
MRQMICFPTRSSSTGEEEDVEACTSTTCAVSCLDRDDLKYSRILYENAPTEKQEVDFQGDQVDSAPVIELKTLMSSSHDQRRANQRLYGGLDKDLHIGVRI